MAKHLRLVKKHETKPVAAVETHSSFIDPNDFTSISLKVSLLNSTTKTEIRDGKRVYGIGAVKTERDPVKEDLSMVITQFGDSDLTLEIPARVCANGHSVTIKITAEGITPEISFTASGKIESTEKLADGREEISLKLTQFDEVQWTKLLETYSKRQEEILDFFQSVRGY